MSVYEYGEFAKWLTDLAYLSILFTLGLDSSMMYFNKKGYSLNESLARNLLIGLSMLVFSIVVIETFSLDRIRNYTLMLSIFSLVSISSVRSYYQISENYKRFGQFLVLMPLIMLLLSGIVVLLDERVASSLFFISYAFCSFLIMATTIFYFCFKKRLKIPAKILKVEYLKYGFKSAINRTLSLLLYASTVLCLYYFSTSEVVAVFFVASTISKLIWVLPDAAGNYLYPKFIKIGEKYSEVEINKEMFLVSQLLLAGNLLAVIIFYLIGDIFLDIFYADEYKSAFNSIIILLIGNQGMVYYKILSRYLAAKNMWEKLRISLICAIIVNLILNFTLIDSYGLLGASIATAVSFWVCGLFVAMQVKGSVVGFLNLFSLVLFLSNKFTMRKKNVL